MAVPKPEDLPLKISEQEEQLIRYKKRLQDVVAAHKKLIAEKEQLEETLRTISHSIETPSDKYANNDEEINELKAKITKLAQSLSFLIEEKSHTETQFQLERKQLIQQNTQLEEKLKKLTSLIANSKKQQEVEAEHVKTQLNLQSNERELDFSSNIRELQKIITDERRKREEKEIAIEKLKNQLKEALEKLNESRNKEQNLQSQLEDVKKQLENDNAPLVVMEKLKRELLIMKEQHSYAVQQEQERALKAEDRARKLAIEHENRVSKLEQKLTQLSDLASNYDKYRQEDQQTIMKLKNRLMQLELESSNVKCEDDRVSLNEETLIQQLQHIKRQLILGCKTGDQLKNLKDILLDGLEDVLQDELKYKKQYMQLKHHFEEYMKKTSKDQVDENIPGNLSKHKIHILKSKILELESYNAKLKEELKIQQEQMTEALEKERQIWKSKMNVMESEYRNKFIVLEKELEKQRERISTIVDEKEKELINLQQHFYPLSQFSDDVPLADAKKSSRGINRRQSSTLIYYLEDAARKEAEINRLRKENNELEVKIHTIEKECFQQMQSYAQLQQDIQRSEKQQNGTDELNTRYLKNVFLNYLITLDPKMRSHMLNAIFAILKFSDLEMNRVLKLKQQI